jgi:phospholipid-translocating ATPase
MYTINGLIFKVPADCVLFQTTEVTGTCFIRTDQLDGETDWKLRIAVPYTQKIPNDEALMSHCGSIYGILNET